MKPIRSTPLLTLILVFGLVDALAAQTETIRLVKDIHDTGDSFPKEVVEVNGILFFAADDGVHGIELWRSGGTEGTTSLVKDINTAPIPVNRTNSSLPRMLTAMADRIFFVAYRPETGNELWTSDGTEKGTRIVKDIMPGPMTSKVAELVPMGGKLYFVATDPEKGRELWVSDGTPAGTRIVRDIREGSESSKPTSLYYAGDEVLFKGDKLLFSAIGDDRKGREVWVTTGAGMQTWRQTDIHEGTGSSDPRDFTLVNGMIFFVARDKDHGRELWGMDSPDPFMVRDIIPGTGTPQIRDLTAVDTRLYFTAENSSEGRELWRTDGIWASTVSVRDLMPGPKSSRPALLTPLPADLETTRVGSLVFVANGVIRENGVDKDVGREAWVVDNGTNKVELLKDIDPAVSNVGPTVLTRVGERFVWFAAGGALYRTDGTPGGTSKHIDLAPEVTGPVELTPADGSVYFSAFRGDVGKELFSVRAGAVAHIPPHSANESKGKLEATDPVMGAVTAVHASKMAANAVAVLVAGTRARPAWRIPGVEKHIYLDPNTMITIAASAVGPQGEVRWEFQIPNDPNLLGLIAILQAAYALPPILEVTGPVELWVGKD